MPVTFSRDLIGRSNKHFSRRVRQAIRQASARRLQMECLELRSLMAGDVAGTIIDDIDNSGTKNNGENGLEGWTVYIDLNRDGSLTAGEPAAATNIDGDYLIKNVAAGTQNVREILPLGWTPATGTFNNQDVLVQNGKEVIADFYSYRSHVGSIEGTVWQDLNGDGVRATDVTTGAFVDPAIAGWTVFIDLNNNRAPDAGEPITLTNVDGHYQFSDLAPGDYEVTEVLPDGWDVAVTYDSRQTVAVFDSQVSTAQDFANISTLNGSIQGTIWNDLNGDGLRETNPLTGSYTEPALEGWTVFLDLNNNRSVDAGEPTALTNADGMYTFTGLVTGDYEVTELLPPGWNVSTTFDDRQTVAVSGGMLSVAGDFANFSNSSGSIRGIIWNDLDANGVRAIDSTTGMFTEPPLTGWMVYLDLNGNGAKDSSEPVSLTDTDGVYSFVGLQIGDYDVIEILPPNWEPTLGFDGNWNVAVFGGTVSVAPDFANFLTTSAIPATVSGTVWNDVTGNGVRDVDAATGLYSDPGLANWTVFVDLNSNSVPDGTEPQAITDANGLYTITNVTTGTVNVTLLPMVGWRSSAPATNVLTLSLRSGQVVGGIDFGNAPVQDAGIRGTVFADYSGDGVRGTGERGLAGITVYLDLNDNGSFDAAEPSTVTSEDLYFTPGVDEAGRYSFTHLAAGTYTVRATLPAQLSATPANQLVHVVTLVAGEVRSGVDTAAVFRASEIHGVRFDDSNANHQQDSSEVGRGGVTVYVDINRNNLHDAVEPSTVTGSDGTYSFTGLTPGAYVVREVPSLEFVTTYPQTVGGILWPAGVSHPAVGNVSPQSITTSLAAGEKYQQTVSLTLPTGNALTNMVDVFLLFDDTGSFVNNSPIVRSAFPAIISQLQTSLAGIDLGFGVGRFEEYANFADEYDTGRPFVLNQPIVAASTSGYQLAVQAALDRTTPGYGGDQPETDIEALYQLVTGLGFDGNNNGSVLDSGAAGLASTQIMPGSSGDVPSFASFLADPSNNVAAAAGTVGGAGFRAGALPIVLLATDTGFAYQPKGETSITGVGGLSLPVSALSETSRLTTPFNYGAGLQETVTGLNALGALVIGLGTNSESTLDPRQGLEALSKLTGAVNNSTSTIDNGTIDPIAPGDPLYFQIASGFASSVATGVVNAIQNAVTNVAVNVTVQASDPRVKIINHTGVINGVGSGQTATFDIEFVGDGVPRRFDLQFVRAGTNVVLGSIPVVIGTPVSGDGYEFVELEDGEFEQNCNFGAAFVSSVVNVAPSFVKGADQTVLEDGGLQAVSNWATNISAGESGQTVDFQVSTDLPALFQSLPAISSDGTLTYTPAANAHGTATVTVSAHDNGGIAGGGVDTSAPQAFTITIGSVNDAPIAANDSYSIAEDGTLAVVLPGILTNDTDLDGDLLQAYLVGGPSHGTLNLNADGSFTYAPEANFSGQDSFTYLAKDGSADSNIATVTIDVQAVNDAPLAVDDSYTTAEDTPLAIAPAGVLVNDSDLENDSLSATLVAGPQHGTVTLLSDGSFLYTPATNFNGLDSFTYQVSDGAAVSNIATVLLNVSATNDAPVANDESYSATEDVALSIPAIGVLGNDSDTESDLLSAVLVTSPQHGTLALSSDGSFLYSPVANFNGVDTFTYRANDGAADSNIATVTINVQAVNDPPVAQSDTYATDQGVLLVVPAATGLLKNDSDLDSNSLSALLVTGPSHGSLSLATDGSFQFTPAAGYSGPDSFTYRASDGIASSGLATVTITIRPVVPQAGVKFIVVDGRVLDTFGYDASGHYQERHDLVTRDQGPRGITTDLAGTRTWVVDSKGEVFVYSDAGKLLGSWTFKGLDKPEGITTDGTNIWIVDRGQDRMHFFKDAALRMSGSIRPTSSFALHHSNQNAMDVTTDGSRLWVVDDTASVDRVFCYGLGGKLQGNWRIDNRNSSPTGLTIDPQNVNHIWIVDSHTDRVYQYNGAATRLSGQQLASMSFPLQAANTNPQGIVDPVPHSPSSAFTGSQTNSLGFFLTNKPSSSSNAGPTLSTSHTSGWIVEPPPGANISNPGDLRADDKNSCSVNDEAIAQLAESWNELWADDFDELFDGSR